MSTENLTDKQLRKQKTEAAKTLKRRGSKAAAGLQNSAMPKANP
jgi:hypothetical protein